MTDLFDYFYVFLFFGWIPIVALKYFICGIIDSIKDKQCQHDLVYEEIKVIDEFSNTPTNVSVSVTCKKCGYHKAYLKYKN